MTSATLPCPVKVGALGSPLVPRSPPIISTTTMSSDQNQNPLGPTPQDDADRVNKFTTSFVTKYSEGLDRFG